VERSPGFDALAADITALIACLATAAPDLVAPARLPVDRIVK
jgi:hypothetical protein